MPNIIKIYKLMVIILLFLLLQCGGKDEKTHLLDLEGLDDSLKSGEMYFKESLFQKALPYYQKALELSRKQNKEEIEAQCLLTLGKICNYTGYYKKALMMANQVLKIYKKSQNHAGMGKSLSLLGSIYRWKGDYKNSLKYHLEALAMYKKSNQTSQTANCWTNIGLAYIGLKDYPKAKHYLRRSRSLSEKLNDIKLIAHSQLVFGFLTALTTNQKSVFYFKQVGGHFEKALRLYIQSEDKFYTAFTLNRLGYLNLNAVGYEVLMTSPDPNIESSLRLDYYKKSMKLYKESLRILQSIGIKRGSLLAATFWGLAGVQHRLGNYKKAKDFQVKAIQLYEEIEHPHLEKAKRFLRVIEKSL